MAGAEVDVLELEAPASPDNTAGLSVRTRGLGRGRGGMLICDMRRKGSSR